MSKDIRSFFSTGNKKPSSSSSPSPHFKPKDAPVKRKAIISSDEDEVPETPPPKLKDKTATKKRRVLDSDDEKSPKKPSPTKPKLEKLKPVNISDVYSSKPVKRVEAQKPQRKPDLMEEIELHSDEEFEKTLISMDDSGLLSDTSNISKNGNKSPEPPSKKEILPDISKLPKIPKKVSSSPDACKDEKKTPPKIKKEDSFATPEIKKKEPKKTPKASVTKKEPANLNDSVLTDEERHERKRASAMLYQKFKARGGPSNPGSKEIPKGKPNCLAGLQFLVTGMLESMERDEAASVIKELGGKVVQSVSKKLTHMVVGDDAGPAKLAKAEELGIPQISEDDLLNLIREKSGIKVEKPKEKVKKEEKSPKREEKSPKKVTKVKEEVKTPKKEDTHKRKKTEENSDSDRKIKKEKQSPAKTPAASIKKEYQKSPKDIPMEREVTKYQKDIASEDNKAWVEKYKPTDLKSIIGQSGAAANAQKLLNWLSKWHTNHDGKKKLAKPNPWAKNDDGSFFKAALLSGSPGVGKTTTATLVCKELGLDTVEFNASDTRSKRLLKEEVSDLLTNKSLFGYFNGSTQKVSSKHVLLMDEVDGMAGNEDRGGMAELIALIKDSNIPVICMCNDRNHPKIRSLVNYCYDLRFNKPNLMQIRGAMLSVCFKEGLKISPEALGEIIIGTGNDIRQTLNHLALYSAGAANLTTEKAKKQAEISKKDIKMGPWEVVRRVFSAEDHKTMSIHDKSDLFFHDYSLSPLFVQENYLKVQPKVPKNEVIDRVALAADSLSRGDLVDKRIRSNMSWSLLPLQAMYSSVIPGEYMAGTFGGQINFPGWLGKNSKSTKRKRMAQEIHDHTRIRTSGSRLSVRLDYAPFLIAKIVKPLIKDGADGVQESLNVIKEYHLLREDVDSLIELTTWPKKKGLMDGVDGRVKAALTRTYNKEVAPYSYSVMAAVKKKKAEVNEEEMGIYGEDEDEGGGHHDSDEEKEDESVENSAFIKVKKKAPAKAAASSSKTKTSATSKGKKK